jgi:hypothetical protein
MAAYTGLSASTAAVANRFVVSVNMANGAYVVANPSPAWQGGCRVTATITANTGNDTPGSITIVGTGLNGQPVTEVLPLVAAGTATSVNVFRTITSITQAGWVINGGNDTIVIGCEAGAIVASGNGKLYGVVVNTTAAAAVVLADSARTIATLKASIAEGHYLYGPGVDFVGFLRVSLTGANDITVIADGSPNAA